METSAKQAVKGIQAIFSTTEVIARLAICLATLILVFGFALSVEAQESNSTYTAMYFHSQVADASQCADAMSVTKKDQIVFDKSVTNPAITCPDAFGWKQFIEAIDSEFWKNWAYDQTLWVSEPKPLCNDKNDNDCCFVKKKGDPQVGYRDPTGKIVKPEVIGGSGKYCPYIPGDWGGASETEFAEAKPVTSHNTTFLRSMDPARVARQREAEIVYRNDAFVRYTSENELYSKAGLVKVFARMNNEAQFAKPYRPNGQGVSYTPDSVMFKVDWIPEKVMIELGYVSDHDKNPKTPPQDPDNPYITMQIKAKTGKGELKEGIYYLAAITGASKAIPNWHWYAFEHVNNLGRCDFTGCNDSYGFQSKVIFDGPEGSGHTLTIMSNFITPRTQSDQLNDQSDLFVLGTRYPSGEMSKGLKKVFDKMDIGESSKVDYKFPSKTDKAWRSYRLKGTQTQFYNRDGYATRVGASITEGGFVNTASCMSCHVQASVNAQGGLGVSGVGATGRLNLFGIGTVVDGAPHSSDYFDRGTANVRAVQIDFVWGILNAQ